MQLINRLQKTGGLGNKIDIYRYIERKQKSIYRMEIKISKWQKENRYQSLRRMQPRRTRGSLCIMAENRYSTDYTVRSIIQTIQCSSRGG